MDFEEFERRISHDTNTFILCNPQNPTGNCWSQEDLLRLGEICLRRRVVVLADEIHCDFVTKGNKYTPFASLPNKDDRQQQHHVQGGQQVVRPRRDEVRVVLLRQRRLLARVKANHRADLTTLGMIASKARLRRAARSGSTQCDEYIDGNHDFVEQFVKANIPMIKVRQAAGHLPDVAGRQRGRREDQREAAGRGRPARASRRRTKPLSPEQMVERYFVKNAKVHMNAGRVVRLGRRRTTCA